MFLICIFQLLVIKEAYVFNTLEHKKVITMKKGVTHISESCLLKTYLDALLKTFVNNGYPLQTIKRSIDNTDFYNEEMNDTNQQKQISMKLLMVENISHRIVALLKKTKRQYCV